MVVGDLQAGGLGSIPRDLVEQLLPCVPIGARDEGCSGRRCEDPAAVERGSMHSMPHFARSSRRTVRHWPNGGVSYYDCRVEVHRSARKHGISDDDIHTAAQQYLIAYTIDDDQPPRELRLGFDTRGRLLEIVVLLMDDGTELAIHAMKARPQYLDLIP